MFLTVNLIIILVMLRSVSSNQSETNNIDWCFDTTRFLANQTNNCHKIKTKLYCIGDISNEFKHFEHYSRIEEILLCNYTHKIFDPTITITKFKNLKLLTIEHGNLLRIKNNFPELHQLQIINISWTQLDYLNPTVFMNIKMLRTLDLRWNQIKLIERPPVLSDHLEDIYLAGNPWNCSENMEWINSNSFKYLNDRDQLICADAAYIRRPVTRVMEYKQILKDECKMMEIKNCTCAISYIMPDFEHLFPINLVNCSNLGLTVLPTILPANTTILHIENNKIDNLEMLISNPRYEKLRDIYLDYNLIRSIDPLEDSFWLKNFRIFSLRGNQLRKLPFYSLQNSLEKNLNVGKIYLSDNPWLCNCLYVPKFQGLLQKYLKIITDRGNITCRHSDDVKLVGRQIMSLRTSEVCKLPIESRVHPLDIVIVVLATLIILILSKLGYDYYRYRRYGKVPWIVSKMP